VGFEYEDDVGPQGDAPIMCFATKGAGSNEEARIVGLLRDFPRVIVHPFHRARKIHSAIRLLRQIRRERPKIVVMEGTGLAGGIAVLLARTILHVPYVVSSGDAVGPILGLLRPWAGRPGVVYERLLCRRAAGFIGWTPYLVGRAVTFGAPRAMTAANWTLHPTRTADRELVRERLGIPPDALVFGIAGALVWTDPPAYCYGLELVRALRLTGRKDVRVLIIGGGSGLPRLEEAAGDELGRRIILTGPIQQELVLEHLAAMDVASLPQSTDEIGSLRYTTKLSEYVTARLPIVTSQVPLAYDLGTEWMWRLPGAGPWEQRYIAALSTLMSRLTAGEIDERRTAMPARLEAFDADAQRRRVTVFITDLLDEARR
jgi:hypothetical protein